ncbi:MAG: acylneuraminate cytidylyltransferase family protein [Patescibacteria group bacterium]|nr:acylneuraminate cytidylyltransferase family protein [Patescibacteria group bacterium]
MKKKDNVVAIIIARGGSKSIPRKNVLDFKGKPLIAWPIDLAKSVPGIDRVVVSTEDDEIAEIAKKYGAEVPFKRPAELAQDETPTLPVLQHCVKYLEEHEGYRADIIVLLYPTSPLLRGERIEQALELFRKTDCNTVISVIKDWGRFWKLDESDNKYKILYPLNRVNRQYYKPLYRENGAIYFSRYEVLMKMDKIVDDANAEFVVMDEDENVDIDNPADLLKARKK